jgi:DNA-binding beta-propeller fold protein YncE
MKHLMALLGLSLSLWCVSASAGTLFCGAYPYWVLVIDESQGKITDKIRMETGLPTSVRISQDHKTIFVTTNDRSGVEVIDVATRKVTNHFVLNDATHKFRLNGGAPDPDGKLLYTTTTQITKQADRYEIGKPKYTIVDLAQQKIAKTVDQPGAGDSADAEGAAATGARGGGGGGGGGGGRGGGGFEVSPDGKYLYQFGSTVTVLNSADFSLVERIQLAQPEAPAMENLGLGGLLEAISDPGQRVSIFNYSDPIVHNRVFGLARFDLNTRKFDFTPIGPAPVAMTGLHVTPDKKSAYTVSTNGTGGNKRCEFWGLDLTTSRLTRTGEFPCRTRYSFGMSADGKKLYIYGAGFEIEVYDAVTFKHEATWDLGNDMTGGGLVVVP